LNTQNGGAAFPRPYSENTYWDRPHKREAQSGMSLRDYFAGQALMGIVARGDNDAWEFIAKSAYAAADAMIEERER